MFKSFPDLQISNVTAKCHMFIWFVGSNVCSLLCSNMNTAFAVGHGK